MESRPKAPDVEEVLAGLDQSWQELVKLLKRGHGRPTSPRPEPQESVPPGSDLQEDSTPSPDIDRVRHWISPAPGDQSTKQPEDPVPAAAPEPTPEKSPPRGRGQRVFNIAILLLLAASLGGLSYLLAQTQWGPSQVDTGSLAIRGKDGLVRAWLGERDGQVSLCLLDKAGRTRAQMSLDADGSPSLSLLDELQKNRVELKLGAGGEPRLSQVKEPETPVIPESKTPAPPGGEAAPPAQSLPATPAPKTTESAAGLPENHESPAAAGPTQTFPEQSQAPGSPLAEATSEAPVPVPAGKFVGSKTSNKYHYPECRWAKKIRPERLLNFGSAEDAREQGYIPCPVCKPPKGD